MSSPDKSSFSLDELSQESGIDTRVIRSFIEHGLLRGPSSLGRYARYSRQHLHRLLAIKIMKEKQGLRLSEVRQQLLAMSEAEIAALAETGMYSPARQDSPDSALDYIVSQSRQFMNSTVVPVSPAGQPMFDDDDDYDLELTSKVDDQPTGSPHDQHTPKTLSESIKEKLGFAAGKHMAQSTPSTTQDDEAAPYPVPPSSAFWPQTVDDEQRITGQSLATPVDRLLVGLKQQAGEQSVRKQSKKEVWHRIQVTPDVELSVRGINDEYQLARFERVADYLREILNGGLNE